MLNTSKLKFKGLSFFAALLSSEHSRKRIALRSFGLLLKILVSFFAIYYITERVFTAESELSLLGFFSSIILSTQFPLVLIASILLMFINWSLEVVKWKILIDTQYDVTWKTAIKGVLSGVTFGVFSPNRMGEFVGRVLALAPEKRISGSLLSFVNGLAQTLATFTFGVIGLIYFIQYFGIAVFGSLATLAIQFTVLLSLVLAVLVYFKMDALTSMLNQVSWLSRFQKHFVVFEELPSLVLSQIYHLSLLRFLTFIFQYVLVFYLILDSPNWFAIIGSSILTLFSTTLLPFLPIPDLLLRESIALSYFDMFNFDLYIVSVAVFCVWAINVALPAILGAFILFTYRIFRKWS